MDRVNALDYISLILVIIGGLNWGLVGLFGFNLVDTLFGTGSAAAQIIYIIIGLAALYTMFVTYKVKNKAAERT